MTKKYKHESTAKPVQSQNVLGVDADLQELSLWNLMNISDIRAKPGLLAELTKSEISISHSFWVEEQVDKARIRTCSAERRIRVREKGVRQN